MGDLSDTTLADTIPQCYTRLGKTITGWTEGYQQEGRLVHRRKFPIMFEKYLEVPLEGEFEISGGNNRLEWLLGTSLRPFAVDAGRYQRARGYDTARDLCRRSDPAPTIRVATAQDASNGQSVRCMSVTFVC